MSDRYRILHVNSHDIAGGAEKMALELTRGCRNAGHKAWLAVGTKRSDCEDVLQISDHPHAVWPRFMLSLSELLEPHSAKSKIAKRIHKRLRRIPHPVMLWDRWRGHDVIRYPGTSILLDVPPEPVDIVHCHNLHAGYFDLHFLPRLSQRVPVVLSLHDEWILTGHCAYTLGCERWRSGCGSCPDLDVYPPIRRDATATNWKIKHKIYNDSKLFVTTASQWLMSRAHQSMLASGIVSSKVIPYAIDLTIFHQGDQNKARGALGLPSDSTVLFASASNIRSNQFKDFETIKKAVQKLSTQVTAKNLILIALGSDGPSEKFGRAEIKFVPFQKDPETVAKYYQAADLFLHAAHSEAWGLTITEALACGTPVIATAVGGISEQIRCLDTGHANDRATGILVPPRDSDAMARATVRLLSDADLRQQMSDNAAHDAQLRFGLERYVAEYLQWYGDVIAQWQKSNSP